ncbi:MAG TPA: rhamnogalacturonan acetylesterase [Ignavibacteriaceae bacterium]
MKSFPRICSFIICILVPPNIDAIYAQEVNQQNEITIFMIGNSTMADKPYDSGNPEKGWGQVFPLFFKEGVKIENHAVNGRSTKSFIDQGRWEVVREKIKPGDYVIIEFGHNDAKKEDSTRFADANTDYRFNLEKFVNETTEKGGIPILATPIVRRRFDKQGNFYDVHGDYPKVVREVAAEKNVILLDMQAKSETLLILYGEENSKQLYLHIAPGEYPSLPNGKIDDTHFSPTGAFRMCDLAIEEIRAKVKLLAIFLKE